jgi:hypothetical protein
MSARPMTKKIKTAVAVILVVATYLAASIALWREQVRERGVHLEQCPLCGR